MVDNEIILRKDEEDIKLFSDKVDLETDNIKLYL